MFTWRDDLLELDSYVILCRNIGSSENGLSCALTSTGLFQVVILTIVRIRQTASRYNKFMRINDSR